MINVLGISHKTAPLDIRGGFAILDSEIPVLSEKILSETEINELVFLSTCNRTEIYYSNKKAYHTKETNRVLLGILHHFKKARTHCTEYFYAHNREEAIKHLFRVTSGMDSMVLGEDQIVKQVKEAYLMCTDLSLTDAVLMRLFQKSFEVAKKVRTETAIQQGATSVSYVAVDLCSKILGDFTDKKILLVGLGDTGSLVLNNLEKRGITDVHLCNRTYEKAEKLARDCDKTAIRFEDFKQRLSEYDIVFTATTAKEYLITSDDIDPNGKSQLLIDLSVPRNIEKTCAENKNIQLHGVDDLMSIINENTQKRKESLADAEKIIDLMAREYLQWLDVRALRPVIQNITRNIKEISSIELEKHKGYYSPEAFRAIEEFSERLSQKYIRTFIKQLKEVSDNGSTVHMLKTINELFDFAEIKARLQQVDEVVHK